jgi:hypothetical protein
MNGRSIDIPRQVLEYAPKKRLRIDRDSSDESAQAIIAMLQNAAGQSSDCERAMSMADELTRQLRAAEDRIDQLETEMEAFRDRAIRAETWLQLIQHEIEENFIAATAAAHGKSTT